MKSLAHVVVLRDAVRFEHHLGVVKLRQGRHFDGADLRDELHDPLAPLAVELVPVLVVVACALLEDLEPALDLRWIGHRVGSDVDAAVDDAVIDPERGRKGEHARRERSHAGVGHFRRDDVERRHRFGEMHRIVKPEALIVLRPEAGVIRIHRLPALGAGGSGDLRGQGEGFAARV